MSDTHADADRQPTYRLLFRDDVDDIDEMPTRASRRIVTAWTVVFAALVVAGAGFVAGIQMEKHNEPAATAAPRARRVRERPARRLRARRWRSPARTRQLPGDGANDPRRADGARPAPGNGTTGKVKLVDGANVYITTSDGSTVKVDDVVDVEGDEERRRRA